MVRFKCRGLRRRGAKRWVHCSLELGNRVIVVVCDRCIVLGVASTEINVSGRIWYFLPCPSVLYEIRDVFFNLAIFESQANLLA